MEPIARWGLVALAIAAIAWFAATQRAPVAADTQVSGKGVSGTANGMLPAQSPAAASQQSVVEALAEKFVEPTGPLADNLVQLSRDAEAGSNKAAYFLATGLYACRRIERGNQVAVSDSEGLPGFSTDCRGLTPEDLAAFKHWLQLAADRGDIEAQVSYALFVGDSFSVQDALRDPAALEDYKRRAIDYLNRAAAAGSPAAFRRLSILYGEGVVAPQNYTLAYAYRMAYMNATGAPAADLDETYFSALPEEEKERARKLAQQLNSRMATH